VTDAVGDNRFLLRDAAALIVVFMGAQVAAVFAYIAYVRLRFGEVALAHLTSADDGLNQLVVVGGVAAVLAVALLLWLIVRRPGIDAAQFGFVVVRPLWFGVAALAFAVLQSAFVGLDFIIGEDLARQGMETMRGMMSSDPIWNIVSAILVVIIIPVIEELVFRVVLFQALSRRMSRALAACLSVAIFVLMHVQYTFAGGWVAVITTFEVALIGAVLMWLYLKSGSIWPSIGLHVANNGFAFAMVALAAY
jgi:membrane protease YdiL (CAAX protease family)